MARCLTLFLLGMLWCGHGWAALRATDGPAVLPALPQAFVEEPVTVPAKTVHVPAGGNLQRVLDAATGNETIVLEAGAVYEGPFVLPDRAGKGWVTIRTSATGAAFPAPGKRALPEDETLMPKLEADSGFVIRTAPGAHNYRLIGLEIRPGPARLASPLSRWLGRSPASPTNLVIIAGDNKGLYPGHIVFDRCYIHGDPAGGTRRGIAMNGRYIAVINSSLIDFMKPAVDAQAIEGWDGPGPFLIENNFLQASGENVMFGGADPSTQGLVPSDIVIRGNHFSKPEVWRTEKNSAGHPRWSVKNLLEFKNARRVLVDGNLFEYNWPGSQNGFAILLTVRNQDGTAPWSTVRDVTFSNNVVRHVGNGINILGTDDIRHSRKTKRVAIANNLFYDLGGQWGAGRFLQLLDGVQDVSVSHNSVFETGNFIMAGEGAPHKRILVTDNIALIPRYGIIGTGTQPGPSTMARYFRQASIAGNLLVAARGDHFPEDNVTVSSPGRAGFVDYSAGDFRLSASSPYHGRVGVDFQRLCAAMSPRDAPALCDRETRNEP